MPPKMPWYEKVLMAPFALLSYLLFGVLAAVLTALWALLCGLANLIDKKIEDSDKDTK